MGSAGFETGATALLAAIFLMISSGQAWAGGAAPAGNEISGIICWVTMQLTGSTGKAIATAAIAVIGLMMLFGKASWGTGFIAATGITLMFSVASIMVALDHSFSCAGISSAPQFFCNGTTPSGNIFDLNQTISQSNDPVDAVFAHTLYFFKVTIGQVMSSMYCAMTDALRVPMSIAITLFVTVFGLMIMGGISNLSLKEASVVLFKIALVWAFATHADWGIGVGYRFFMNFAEEGTNIVLAAIPHGGAATPSITSPDGIILGIFNTSGSGAAAPGQNISDTVPQACLLWGLFFLILLIFFMPFLLLFIVFAIIGYIGNLCRALLNYLTSLVLISFLFIFAPFFMGFALFRTTQPLFTGWLKHLISYSLQMVIMFAFMALLVMLPVASFFAEMVNVLKEYDTTIGSPPLTIPLHFCGICDYNIIPASLAKGNYTPAAVQCQLHSNGGQPATQAQATAAGDYIVSSDKNYYVISILNITRHMDFVIFVITQALALYILSLVFGELIKKAPQIAKELAGQGVSLALGAGGTPQGLKLPGIESIQAGYLAFRTNALRSHRPGVNERGIKKFVSRRRLGNLLNPLNIVRDYGGRLVTGARAGKEALLEGDQGRFDNSLAGKQKRNDLKLAEAWKVRAQEDYNGANKWKKLAEEQRVRAQNELNRLVQKGGGEADINAAKEALRLAERNFRWIEKEAKKYEDTYNKAVKMWSIQSKPGFHGETIHKGLFGQRTESGRSIQESSLVLDMYGQSEDLKALMHRHSLQSIYGSVQEKNNMGFLHFLAGYSEEIAEIAKQDSIYKQKVESKRSTYEKKIEEIRQKLRNAHLPENQKARIEAELSSEASRIHFAESDSEFNNIGRDLDIILSKI